jgi:hypothetical protein
MWKGWMLGVGIFLVTGCVAETELPGTGERHEVQNDETTSRYARSGPEPPNPCVTGMVLRTIDGQEVRVGVPCARAPWLDPSDPPPEEEQIDDRLAPVAEGEAIE